MNITANEYGLLQKTVEKLNSESQGISFQLIEIKGTFYIHPQFKASE